MANYHKLWFKSAVAYTVAGCLSAALVGVVLGMIGSALPWERSRVIAFYLIGFLSLVLAAREWGWIAFELPERKLQSERVWVHSFGFVTASVMWGLHIGLGFATRITYGGFWVLVAVALVVGEPLYGAILMLAYWMGRALPVWVAPSLIESDEEAVKLSEQVFTDGPVYHRVVAIALVWSAVVIVLFVHGASLL